MRINLGSGPIPLEGYVNCDLYPSDVVAPGATEPNKDIDIVFDLREGLPFEDDSAEEVVAFQVLEHLERPELLLKEIYRVLKPSGIIDIAVPDYGIIFQEWLKMSYQERWVSIGDGKWPPLYAWIWGRGDGANRHQSGFDRERLERVLYEVGFKDIEPIMPFPSLSVRLEGKK